VKARIVLASLGELNWLSCPGKINLARRGEASKPGKGTKLTSKTSKLVRALQLEKNYQTHSYEMTT